MSTGRPQEDRLVALRGATTAPANEAGAITAATEELLRALLADNEVAAETIVSIIFTATTDLDAAFPAAAARSCGLGAVPLLCATEIAVPGSLPRCVRVLLHCYVPNGRAPMHVYLREAQQLRADAADHEPNLDER